MNKVSTRRKALFAEDDRVVTVMGILRSAIIDFLEINAIEKLNFSFLLGIDGVNIYI